MKHGIYALLIALCLALIGCGQESGAESKFEGAPLSLSMSEALKKEAYKCAGAVDSVDFDLGCFLRSQNYYFILTNNTNDVLDSIEITSDNPAFEVAPAKIGSIGLADGNTGTMPIVRIGVNHRSPLSSMAESSPLPKGANETTITITGLLNGERFTVTNTLGGFAEIVEYIVEDKAKGIAYIKGPIYHEGKILDSIRVGMADFCSPDYACTSLEPTSISKFINILSIEPIAPLGVEFVKISEDKRMWEVDTALVFNR